MKILLLHDVQAYKQNGVSVSLGILATELKKLGYDMRVLTLSDTPRSYKDENGNYCLSSVPAFVYPGVRLRLRRRGALVKELIDWNPDIIHTNCEFSTFRIAKYIREQCKKPPVWIHTFHTDYRYYIGKLQKSRFVTDRFVPWYLGKCFVMSDALIVPTNKIYTYVASKPFPQTLNTRIIPTGIDFSDLKRKNDEDRAQTRKELGVPDDAKLVIFLGRISAEKNLDELLECFVSYRQKHDNVYLLTVGDGPYKETLAKKVEKLGIGDRVILHDGVAHAQISRYYNAADVFASASESETQGLTFYEALFCNLPVLAKDRACLAEAVNEGENGAFFDDPGTFEKSLDTLLYRDAAESLSALPECFDSEHFASSVAALYEETLKNQKREI